MTRILTPLLILSTAFLMTACAKKGQETASLVSPTDFRARHPIMVSPRGAQLPHKCGQWPEDLGASSITAKLNEPHWNHGCSTQSNLAAMVANPNDLVQQRAIGDSDSGRRHVVIDKYRRGQDTTTAWKSEDKNRVQVK